MITERKFLRWWPLFLTSSLGLFFELAVIRWVAGEVRLFSYFKNLSLLAAFLGLSVGFALVGKGRNFLPAFALYQGPLEERSGPDSAGCPLAPLYRWPTSNSGLQKHCHCLMSALSRDW